MHSAVMAPFGWKKPNPRSVKTTFGKGDPGNRFFSAGNSFVARVAAPSAVSPGKSLDKGTTRSLPRVSNGAQMSLSAPKEFCFKDPFLPWRFTDRPLASSLSQALLPFFAKACSAAFCSVRGKRGAKPGVSGCISILSDSDGAEFNPTRPRGGVGAEGIGVKAAEIN